MGRSWAALGDSPDAILPSEGAVETHGRDLAEAIRTRRKYPGQEEEIGENWRAFREIVRIHRADWPHEYAYWKERGWI